MTSSYLIFVLSGRLFGVKLLGAIEILPWRPSRPVPLSYSYVEGLIDYRGAVYPVFNLGRRLNLSRPASIGFIAGETEQAGGGRSIILLEENKVFFGIDVDGVVKMTKLEEPSAAPDPDPEQTRGIETQYVNGTIHENDQDILILDFERLFHAG